MWITVLEASKQLIKEAIMAVVQLLCRLSWVIHWSIWCMWGTTLSSNRIHSCCLQNLLIVSYSCLTFVHRRPKVNTWPSHTVWLRNLVPPVPYGGLWIVVVACYRLLAAQASVLPGTIYPLRRLAGYSVSYKVYHKTFSSNRAEDREQFC